MAFSESDASPAMMKSWSLLAARSAVSVRVVVRAEWQTAPLCWWTRSCHINPCDSGCLACRFHLRFLFASNPQVMTRVLGIVYRTIATHLAHKAGFTKPLAQTAADLLLMGIALVEYELLPIGGSLGCPYSICAEAVLTSSFRTRLRSSIIWS